jgi:hypothetical protein
MHLIQINLPAPVEIIFQQEAVAAVKVPAAI